MTKIHLLYGIALHEALLQNKYGNAYKSLTPRLQQNILELVERAHGGKIMFARYQYIEGLCNYYDRPLFYNLNKN